MPASPAQHGLILFAHGSRDPLWHAPMQAVAQRIRTLAPDTPVACAYLELTTPDLPSCTNTLITQGVNHLTIVPLFLGVGKHAREDLPQLVQSLREQHPTVQFTLQGAVGEDARVIELLAHIALQVPA